jgi:hypothetical protein
LRAIGTGSSDRLIALGAWLRPYRRRVLSGAVRGLLVSPWFAAGAGVVVAAGAFIYAPHAELEFGNAIGVTQCTVAQCHPTTEQGAPPLPAGTGAGPVATSPAIAPAAVTDGLTFRYAVNWHTHGMFQMVLTVTGKKAIGNWRLAFVIPAATDVRVLGAEWQPSGTDGGTASGTSIVASYEPAAGRGTSAPGEPTPEDELDSAGSQPDAVYLIVDADGTPAAPERCGYDGAACQFSLG